jgi:NADH-quinone oxidoreductase subunit B
MGVSSKLGNLGVVTTTLDAAVNWGRTGAMWPLLFGLACCAIEYMGTQASNYDLARFGMELNRASPRQADLLIVSGRLTRKMAPVVRQLYDQMASPKWVIAMGDCASCGGVYNNYAVVQGCDEIIPVDVYVAGCPPRPEQLLHGILTLHEKIKGDSIRTWADDEKWNANKSEIALHV